ncbi:hypothetical protein AVEN_248703-1 [Araneus ventricosus]|uniref:Uncharacterized protein n=1 Tax=Araneus ventricosus TaxID=182803 RepID=A0A4Y2MC68_ARAVE|nr:hypothetical protein AVEN_248703-1 [Araneus ventricosus]
MARTRKLTKRSSPVKRKSALKQPKGDISKLLCTEKKHVRFPTPAHTNSQKSLSHYTLSELFDVYQRFVHLEMMDNKTVGKKISLNKAFNLLFGCYDEWFQNFLFVSDKRRRKKICCYYET